MSTPVNSKLARLRISLMYIWAVILVLLIPMIFFSFGSGLLEKVGKKIPIREGTFNSQDGSFQLTKPDN